LDAPCGLFNWLFSDGWLRRWPRVGVALDDHGRLVDVPDIVRAIAQSG
jgi:hypothetical protein